MTGESTPPRRRPGILSRIVLLTTAVAAIAVLVAGLVSLPLIRGSAERAARVELTRLADLTATTLTIDANGQYALPRRVASVLNDEQVI
ncbi:MAG: hypothetical protein ACKOT0_07005, partial [bacterium]